MVYDNGTLYGINTTDPVNSHVYLSQMTTGTSSVNTSQNPIPYKDFNGNVAYYLEDDSTVVEFDYILSGKLNIYNVNLGGGTGTTSMSLVKQLNVSTGTSTNNIFGIRKVNSDLYYVYYLITTTSSLNSVFDFRRCSAIPTGTTDTSLSTVTITKNAIDSIGAGKTTIGRNGYCNFSHVYLDGVTSLVNQVDFYFYVLNMEADTVTLMESLNLPFVDSLTTYSNVTSLPVITMGEVKWYISYLYRIKDSPGTDVRHIKKIIWDGATTDAFNLYPAPSLIQLITLNYRYNYRDTKVGEKYVYTGVTYYIVTDSVFGVSSLTNDSLYPDTTPVSFSSEAVFPKIGLSSSVYYWLDANGKATSTITLSGVTTLLDIYPTLDTINGDMYVTAVMNDASNKLLAVDSSLGTINTQYVVTSFPYPALISTYTVNFNHGNFFISSGGSTLKTIYLDAPYISGVGEVLMIIEQN